MGGRGCGGEEERDAVVVLALVVERCGGEEGRDVVVVLMLVVEGCGGER